MMKSKKSIKKRKNKYRLNVCVAIRKKGTQLFLIGHRKGYPKKRGWQFPQGGIDGRRDFLEEMRRELREEIGTDAVRVISLSPRTYCYAFPREYTGRHPGYSGQRQRWVLAEYDGNDSALVSLHSPAEFDGLRWECAREIIDGIVDFKRAVYVRAMSDLKIFSYNKPQ